MRKGLRAMLAWMLVALLAFGALAEGESKPAAARMVGWMFLAGSREAPRLRTRPLPRMRLPPRTRLLPRMRPLPRTRPLPRRKRRSPR